MLVTNTLFGISDKRNVVIEINIYIVMKTFKLKVSKVTYKNRKEIVLLLKLA